MVAMNPIPPIATTGLIIFSVLFVVSSALVLVWRVLNYRYRLRMHDIEHTPKTPGVGAGNKRPPSALWTRIQPESYSVAPRRNRDPHINHRAGTDLSAKPLPRIPQAPRKAPSPVERSYFDVDDDSEDGNTATQKETLASRLVQRPQRAYSRNRLSNLPSSLTFTRGRVARSTPVVNVGPPGPAPRSVNLSPLEQTARVRQTEDVPIVSTPRDLQINMGSLASPRAPSLDTQALEEYYTSAQPGDARNCTSRPTHDDLD